MTMAWRGWIPEIARRDPARTIRCTYRVFGASLQFSVESLRQALHASGVSWERTGDLQWEIELPWRTMVFGLIRRDVDERLTARIGGDPQGAALVIECLPAATHGAHAAGLAGVMVFAVLAWIASGWLNGIPAGLTTLVAGGLWADTTREMGMRVLERRIRRLTEDLGTALWPGVPAETSDGDA